MPSQPRREALLFSPAERVSRVSASIVATARTARMMASRAVVIGAVYAGRVKAVILAGGLGSRLSEETVVRPKPMVEICLLYTSPSPRDS